MARVVIFQYRLLNYRLRLFELLREKLARQGVALILVCGQASDEERTRKDEGELTWATRVQNTFIRFAGKDLVWQPIPAVARAADLYIVMQESRILSNYWLQSSRWWRGTRVAYWGHGRNYQSAKPAGHRERWKTWWLQRVDWWFAYTESVEAHLVARGYPAARVTRLNNAIDDSGFRNDLAQIAQQERDFARAQLQISVDAQVAIYCGSIYAGKRIDVLLNSADLLRAHLPDFHLLVVGDGPDAAVVREASASRSWLHVLGPRNGAEKALYFRLAAVMLNPGSVGLHVVDAFVAGTPLVTQASAQHGPEFDYLVDGINGCVVFDDNPESYADAVVRLFTEPGTLDSMRAQCEHYAEKYTLEAMANHFSEGIVACLRVHGDLRASRPLH
ncbi:MAG: glycosyltransferase family 4 protein [Burkholderiales bacterium]